MHQYSLIATGSPGFVRGLATPAVSLAPYRESTPIRRGYSEEKYLSAVTECSDCYRKKKKNYMRTFWCLKEVLDYRDIVWPKDCYQMITAFQKAVTK